jgi:transcriptional regulator with XRE-family HTH domain
MEKMKQTAGKRLREYRQRALLRQYDVAELTRRVDPTGIGIQKSHLSAMENGKRPITLRHARLLKKVFGVPAHEFLDI